MSNIPTYVSEYDAIVKTMQSYLDGAKAGRGTDMKSTFHPHATIYGYLGTELMAGSIQLLFDAADQIGPAPEIQVRFVKVDIVNTIATVRLEIDNWAGYQFTDQFLLLKLDGEWKVMNKVFHTHATP